MILYWILRFVSGIALRWFYRDVRVRHTARVPASPTPLIVVVNHPNALIDALLVGSALPRRVMITAKATLFENPVVAFFLRTVGVIPLRRASDEQRASRNRATPEEVRQAQNRDAFRAIIDHLKHGEAVLIFPEGKSHDEPALAPLRTGPARIALQAHEEGRVQSLAILPIGLLFEQKDAPRSRVLVDIGEPIDIDRWIAMTSSATGHVSTLTEEINRSLRELTLNYATTNEAVETRELARIFASLLTTPLPVGTDRSLADEAELERRLTAARQFLDSTHGNSELRMRAGQLLDRLDAFEQRLKHNGIAADDVAIPIDRQRGARFAIREGVLLAGLGPIALWGRLNHWLPFRLARFLGQHDITARDQPAMRTILAGLVLVVLFYSIATAIVARVASGLAAAVYLISLPIAADIDLRFTERISRARERMRAYLRLRSDPDLRTQLRAEHAWLASEVGELARTLELAHRASEEQKSSRG